MEEIFEMVYEKRDRTIPPVRLTRVRGGERKNMEKTCPRCGYQRTHCKCGRNGTPRDINNPSANRTCRTCKNRMDYCSCGRRRNTSGDVVRYQNYQDYTKENEDFSRTSRIFRASSEDRKFLEELFPVDGEEVSSYMQRSSIQRREIVEYAMHRHLYGTSKTWPCHTQNRYCPVCVLCQEVEVNRSLMNSLLKTYPNLGKDRVLIKKQYDNTGTIDGTEIHWSPTK